MDFSGKKIVITGGASGIGHSISRFFAEKGAQVFSIDKNKPAEPISGVNYLSADVTSSKQLAGAFKRIGIVDVLINNAGVMRRGKLLESSEDDYNLLFNVNLKAYWLSLKHCELSKHAMVVFVSSRHALNHPLDPALYSLTKKSEIYLAELFEISNPGCDIRLVFPGPTDTPLARVGQDAYALKKKHMVSPEELASKMMRFLESGKKRLVFHDGKYLMK